MTLGAFVRTAPPPSGGSHGSSPSWVSIVVAIVFVVVGLTQLVNPRLTWRMSRWQYKNPEANEPSTAYFTVSRIAGGLFAVIGVVVFVVAVS